MSKNYILIQDIDCETATSEGGSLWNEGSGFRPIGEFEGNEFTGSINGNGHIIKKLFINRPEANAVGLFGSTASGSMISGVGIIDSNVTGGSGVGMLAGILMGTVEKSYSSGLVQGSSSVGGLVGGHMGLKTIRQSYSNASVYGANWVGGLAGENYGNIYDSYASGNVTGNSDVGGLVGSNRREDLVIERSYSSADVNLSRENGNNFGGLAGGIGYNANNSILSSFSVSNIYAEGAQAVGGFIGSALVSSVNLANNAWISNKADYAIFDDDTSQPVVELDFNESSSEPFKNKSYALYTNSPEGSEAWDFDSVWQIISGVNDGLPVLKWQLQDQPPGVGSNEADIINILTGKNIKLKAPEGTTITCVDSITDQVNVDDQNYSYPLGFIDFCLDSNDQDIRVEIIFETDLSPEAVVPKKYDNGSGVYSQLPAEANYSVSKTSLQGRPALTLSYTITDNGSLDTDGTEGKIRDPIGLAVISDLNIPGQLIKTGITVFLPSMIAAASIVAAMYTYVDYRKHKKPLIDMDKEMHTSIAREYTYWHHIRLVTIPLARYRLSVRLEKSVVVSKG